MWSVVYSRDEFTVAGHASAQIALELGADFLILDVEECLKNTEPGGARALIDGVQSAGWTKPVHVTTYGAPEQRPEGGYWDYALDLDSFLRTGGGVLPQAYYAPQASPTGRSPGYAADHCVAYYCDQCGVPPERLNLMIWPDNTNPIQTEIGLLEAAGLGPAFSIFLTETTSAENLAALRVLTESAPVEPPDLPEEGIPGEPTWIGPQHGITAMCNNWRSLWPQWTNQNRNPADLATFKGIDKLERTLLILATDHDEQCV